MENGKENGGRKEKKMKKGGGTHTLLTFLTRSLETVVRRLVESTSLWCQHHRRPPESPFPFSKYCMILRVLCKRVSKYYLPGWTAVSETHPLARPFAPSWKTSDRHSRLCKNIMLRGFVVAKKVNFIRKIMMLTRHDVISWYVLSCDEPTSITLGFMLHHPILKQIMTNTKYRIAAAYPIRQMRMAFSVGSASERLLFHKDSGGQGEGGRGQGAGAGQGAGELPGKKVKKAIIPNPKNVYDLAVQDRMSGSRKKKQTKAFTERNQ
jgi:hypothetical protein